MKVTEGVLKIVSSEGENVCPLKHTDVKANISGFIGITEVTQIFTNPMETPIEAEYIFPLPEKSAVFEMLMKIGDKTIRGIVKEKEEAKAIYNKAIQEGKRASLLDEERPNIFVQHVGNIMPGDEIKILIKYVEDIKYEEGIYEYVFPMTVGPRYIPKSQVGKEGNINPAYPEDGKRAGHDISVSVEINSPINIEEVNSELHEINIEKVSNTSHVIKLAEHDFIPNRDFILKYRLGSETIEEGLISTKIKDKGGFASLIIQPPARPENFKIIPKEMIFVVDTSGSQMGAPLEACKKAMYLCIDKMHANDTFNIICFSSVPEFLFKKSMPADEKNRELAREFMKKHNGGGGTEMMPPILAALKAKEDKDRLRIITIMTDGYVGNEDEIIKAIDQKCKKNTRIFSFGTGDSVNRYLITKMAEAGRGDSEIITVTYRSRDTENENMQKVADAFFKKIDCPLMTNIELNWSGDKISEIYPKNLPDLYSNKPLILIGTYKKGGKGSVTVTGNVAGETIKKKIEFVLATEEDSKYESLPYLWARRKIEYYSDRDNFRGKDRDDKKIKETIIKLGLDFGLATLYTSFVAVEDKVVNEDGKLEHKDVPSEFPSGVSREGFESTQADRIAPAALGGAIQQFGAPIAPPQMCGRPNIPQAPGGMFGGMMGMAMKMFQPQVSECCRMAAPEPLVECCVEPEEDGCCVDEAPDCCVDESMEVEECFEECLKDLEPVEVKTESCKKLAVKKVAPKPEETKFEYDEKKFDKYLKALFEKINEAEEKDKYNIEVLKDEIKKVVKKKVIDKNGKIKVRIKFLTIPEDTLKLIEENDAFSVIEKGEQEVTIELEVNQIALLNLIVISENSSVDKIELA